MRRALAPALLAMLVPCGTSCHRSPRTPPEPAAKAAATSGPSGSSASSASALPSASGAPGPRGPVKALSSGALLLEAEDFSPRGALRPGVWGENYFAATFANTFLSRKAFLGAPEQCEPSSASLAVEIPRAGRYLALVRYEAPYRFEARFTLRIEQGGAKKLERGYGARADEKIWAFGAGLKKDHSWDWGATENLVWQGHDAAVQLDKGPAVVTLEAGPQPEPAARRNLDVVLLTPDEAGVASRMKGEGYLPLDGLLTQEGDLVARVEVPDGAPAVAVTFPPGTEHSPYWVHARTWKPLVAHAKSGEPSPWLEVGSLLDTMNDGQWTLTAATEPAGGEARYRVRFALPAGEGEEPRAIDSFEGRGASLRLAYDADTRKTRRVHEADEALKQIVAHLRGLPAHGRRPSRALAFALVPERRRGDAGHEALVDAFVEQVGLSAPLDDMIRQVPPASPGAPPRGWVDLRGLAPESLEQACKKLEAEGLSRQVAVVSLGDEIEPPRPPPGSDEAFRAYLKEQKLAPSDLVPRAGADWAKVRYPAEPWAAGKPGALLAYHAALFRYRFGEKALRQQTDVIRRYLPEAGIGANYSPHGEAYLGATHKWVSIFRSGALTMPWGEDYAFQLPIGSQQMASIGLDLFRAGTRGDPKAKIFEYVMPHEPGNTPASFRRQFFAALGHGAKVVSYFELRPVQAAYTENYVVAPSMYRAVRDATLELGAVEDLVLDGRVRPAKAGLWFSEAGDALGDGKAPFAAGKRTLYVALRHAQLPLDVLVEADTKDGTLDGYGALYVADRHVSRAASKEIARWVEKGGRLFCTAGACTRDERDAPNEALLALLGLKAESLEAPAEKSVSLEKQDLPFAEPMGHVAVDGAELAVIGARSRVEPGPAETLARFDDGSPALTRRAAGRGTATFAAFLPGLAYFQPALPRRPVDRSGAPGSMAHFLPTAFAEAARALLAAPAEGLEKAVETSDPLVEATLIDAPKGALVPLINWRGSRASALRVTVRAAPGLRARQLASGRPLEAREENGRQIVTLDLDEADAIVLR